MHLSSYGLITLKGTVAKPEPGLGFADYQVALANYGTTLALRERAKQIAKARAEPQPPRAPAEPLVKQELATARLKSKPRSTAGSALVRKFRG